MLQEVLEHMVRGIVSFPGDVHVSSKMTGRGQFLQITTNPEDIGRVIGLRGGNVTALRTVIDALADGENVRVDIHDKFGK